MATRSTSSSLRIVVEPSDYVIRNSGDTAMLQVALERLSVRFPAARIEVFSDEPASFPFNFASVQPTATDGRRAWFDMARKLARASADNGPRGLQGRLLRACWERWPAMIGRYLVASGWLSHVEASMAAAFVRKVQHADLLVVTGMGGITDAFATYTEELLKVLQLAQRSGVRTVLLGQGLGPLEGDGLRDLAREALPRADLIALRERRAGTPLCHALGVVDERVMVTGDDAIELAVRYRTAEAGGGLGVNVRAAPYSEVDRGSLGPLRRVIERFARQTGAPIIPVPISRVPGEEDAATIRGLLVGLDPETDGGQRVNSPEAVIRQLHQCRVLVAGSYHAGVFALAIGVPTVGLVRSSYYEDKFLGLADMFEVGCETVRFDAPDVERQLEHAISRAWSNAESLRPTLIAAADRQLVTSQRAFDMLASLVGRQ